MLTHLFQSSISYLCSGLRGGLIPAEFSKTEGVRLSFANPLNPSSIESWLVTSTSYIKTSLTSDLRLFFMTSLADLFASNTATL